MIKDKKINKITYNSNKLKDFILKSRKIIKQLKYWTGYKKIRG